MTLFLHWGDALRPGRSGRGVFGGLLSLMGLALSFGLDPRFGVVIAPGFACDLLVYTAWLKRRMLLSIVFGGTGGYRGSISVQLDY